MISVEVYPFLLKLSTLQLYPIVTLLSAYRNGSIPLHHYGWQLNTFIKIFLKRREDPQHLTMWGLLRQVRPLPPGGDVGTSVAISADR
ncbi:MAG: hypothetical protein WC817_01830 [Patescibacteria group bacterium]|jgi:hypothetical protein